MTDETIRDDQKADESSPQSAAFISPAPPPVEIREPRGGLKPTKPVKTQTTGPR